MPVRIYDLAKKLGVESKAVLDQARELGIVQAKVPSSMLDKITAEFLEETLVKKYPPPDGSQLPQPSTTLDQAGVQQAKSPGITIRTVSPEVHDLIERVLAGEVPFVLEVSRGEGCPPLRAKLIPEVPATTMAPRRSLGPTPRAELDEHTRRIFLGAYYYASSASKDGWVNLAEYGSTLKKQDPTFQPQDFGEKSLGTLVRRMIDVFDMKADGNSPPVYYIRLKPQTTTIQPQPVAPPPPQSTKPRRHGTGKIHNLKLGFGFIAPDDGSENAFFHATEVVGCTIFDLRPGDPVEYEAGVNEQGPCAWKVTRLTTPLASRIS
jgi:cold shock CspA family protein